MKRIDFSLREFAVSVPAVFAAVMGVAGTALANESASLEKLEQRIIELEQSQLVHEGPGIEFGAAIEVEAGYSDGGDTSGSSSSSDIGVATVELVAEGSISEELSAAIVLLYEEDDTELDVDAAEIYYAPKHSSFSFVLGKTGVPFGSFSTALVNDSLALEMGETIETALVINYEQGLFSGSLYVFNGEQDDSDRDTISNYGGRITLNTDATTIGVDYISSLADSDGMQELDFGFSASQDLVAGMSVFGEFQFGDVHFSAEHLTAFDTLLNDGDNSEPSVSHLEVSFDLENTVVAAAVQQTDEALFLGLPEQRLSIGMSRELSSGMDIGVELGRDEDYAIINGGSGSATTNAVVQFAVEI